MEPPADVVVYTTRFCGFCHAAKRLLTTKGVAFEEVPCDTRPDLRAWLRDASGQHTVPQIFINRDPIGGYSELASLEAEGELDGRLATSPDEGEPLPR